MTPYEAWCAHCRVSHPPGTRTCLHCGGRVAPSRAGAEASWSPVPTRGPSREPAPPEPDAELEGAPAARPLRMAMAALWVLLAIAGTLWQRCQNAP